MDDWDKEMKKPIQEGLKPIQEGFEQKPGYCLDPFMPLWMTGESPSEGIATTLYVLARTVDSIGNKADYQIQFEELTEDIRDRIFSWYEIGLKAWKIKLHKVWETNYSSFRDFCERALGRTAGTINSCIRAARVCSQLISYGFSRLPQSASVCVELSRYEEHVLGDIWRQICDKYQDHEITLEKVKAEIDDPLGEKPQFKQVRIPIELWEQLREVAANGGISTSKLLEGLIEDYFPEKEEPETPEPEPEQPIFTMSQEIEVYPSDDPIAYDIIEGQCSHCGRNADYIELPDGTFCPSDSCQPCDDYNLGLENYEYDIGLHGNSIN